VGARSLGVKDAAQVSADAMTIGMAKAHWLGPSHFFRSGKLIVLCVGNDEKALRTLQARLGPPLAGG
jgi:folylpolyglutamate synthase/dihydropteroate synthase